LTTNKQRIKKLAALTIIVTIAISTCYLFNHANASESYTTTSYSPIVISSGTKPSLSNDHLLVYYQQGVKVFSFVAFNFSDFPKDANVISATLKLKCIGAFTSSFVSAFATLGADWIGKNLTWNTKPIGASYIDAQFFNTMNDWYTFSSNSLNAIVSRACRDNQAITIGMKTGIESDDEIGIIVIDKQAVLEITYSNSSSSPTPVPSVPEFSLITIPLLAIGGLVTAITYKRISVRK
jgi:hypothetical protein